MKVLFFTISALFAFSQNCHSQDWKLSWSEEFEYQGLPDEIAWNYFKGMAYNNESQYYRSKRLANSRVENGMLVIEALKEKHEGAEYTSARIMTKSK